MTGVTDFLVPPLYGAPWLQPYWEGVRRGELCLPRCSGCHVWQWYPLESGPCCRDAYFEWLTISPWGTVFTFTEVRKPLLPGVTTPYITGLVIPDDAPRCRIATRLVAASDARIQIDSRARFAVVNSDEGEIPYFLIEVHK